MEIINI